MQSTLHSLPNQPFHVAIIMDGNGRWAQQQNLSRSEGHREGSKAVRRTVEAAPDLGISTLTLYAFSSDNWRRPDAEVSQLMELFHDYLQQEKLNCIQNSVRLSVIGRRDRLSLPLRTAIRSAEWATLGGQRLHLRIAIDYSSRDSILHAAKRFYGNGDITRERFAEVLGEVIHSNDHAPDVDLLIRTAGEQRLSDFLLWECAYAELHFTQRMWPEFGETDLQSAVEDFKGRTRRFGAVKAAS